ncbi:hypothetical protein GCM10027267_14160 [Paramicrobacterium agarici]
MDLAVAAVDPGDRVPCAVLFHDLMRYRVVDKPPRFAVAHRTVCHSKILRIYPPFC